MPPGVNYITGPAERIPFPDGFFSHVFCSNALDHFEDPEAALAEMCRVLDGYCIITVDVFRPEKICDSNLLHPHAFTLEHAENLIGGAFSIIKTLRRHKKGGKLGFNHMVAGKTKPRANKTEIMFIARTRNRSTPPAYYCTNPTSDISCAFASTDNLLIAFQLTKSWPLKSGLGTAFRETRGQSRSKDQPNHVFELMTLAI